MTCTGRGFYLEEDRGKRPTISGLCYVDKSTFGINLDSEQKGHLEKNKLKSANTWKN